MSMTALVPEIPRTPLERLRRAALDGWIIAVRDLTYWVREPARVVFTLMYPIMMVLLFGYVFGSAMTVAGGGDYREFLMPGMFAMTMMFGGGATMVSVTTDNARGVMDRFRSMPMARSGVLIGRSIADIFNSTLDLIILVVCGLVVSWRWKGTFVEGLPAFGLLFFLWFSMIW